MSASDTMFTGTYIPYAKPPKPQSKLVRAVSSWFTSSSEDKSFSTTSEPVRDFRFDTGIGIVYFSTRVDLCKVLGFYHGERVQVTKGPLTGIQASVVGMRGGTLYVVFDNEATASPLLDCHTMEELEEVYGLMKVRGAKRSTLPQAPYMVLNAHVNNRTSEMGSGFTKLFNTAQGTSSSSIPEEVINFLKYAPDLEIIVDFSDNEEDFGAGAGKRGVVAPLELEEDLLDTTGGLQAIRENHIKRKRSQRQYVVHLCPTFTLTSNGVVGWSGEDRIRVLGGGITPGLVSSICKLKKKAVLDAQLRDGVTIESVSRDVANYYHSVPCFATGTVLIPAHLSVATASKVVSMFHTSEEWDDEVNKEAHSTTKAASTQRARSASRDVTQEELRVRGRKSGRSDVHILQDSEDAVSMAHEYVTRRTTLRSTQMSQPTHKGGGGESRKSVSFSQHHLDDDVFSQRLSQVPNGNDLLHALEEGSSRIDDL